MPALCCCWLVLYLFLSHAILRLCRLEVATLPPCDKQRYCSVSHLRNMQICEQNEQKQGSLSNPVHIQCIPNVEHIGACVRLCVCARSEVNKLSVSSAPPRFLFLSCFEPKHIPAWRSPAHLPLRQGQKEQQRDALRRSE